MNELSKVSNDRLEFISANALSEERREMARELLAYRKERERAEPVAWRWRWSDDEEGHWRYTEDRRETRGSVTAAPLYAAPPAPVVPEGLRIALSNAGIAAPESDEALWASQQDYIQALVTWVKDRRPFKLAPFVPDDGRARQEYEKHVRSRYQYPMLERHPEDGSPWHGEYKESARQMEWEDWQCSWNACIAARLTQPTKANNVIGQYQGADGMPHDIVTLGRTEPVSQPYKLPSGWVAVPVEPTAEMCDIGHIGVDVLTGVTEDNEYYSINGPDAAKVYRAMLAAAPAPGKEG